MCRYEDHIQETEESANQDLQNRLLNLESANLMQELQSISNKCIAKIGFVDIKYEYLMDRILTLQSEVVTIQTLCKKERLSLIDKIRSLESCVSEEHNRWYDSMKNLESQAREEVHSLEQTLCARLQALEETLCKHDKEPNKQKGKTIKVVTSPNGSNPMAYPVIIHERPADDTHPEPYVTHTLQPISIRDFKNMKEAIVTYGIHSTYVKQMLNSWSTSNRIIPDDWHQLTSAVLEYSQQLQWKSCLREEARNLEQQGILMQREDVILEWIFLPRKPNKKLKTYIEKISDLIHKGVLGLQVYNVLLNQDVLHDFWGLNWSGLPGQRESSFPDTRCLCDRRLTGQRALEWKSKFSSEENNSGQQCRIKEVYGPNAMTLLINLTLK
ncbi:hypothetical protein STEG23_000524, partial [Scotinomys teguina]